MALGINYVALFSGNYQRGSVPLKGLSKTAMQHWIAKDIKGSGYDTTKDDEGNYVCRYAREREQVLWAEWEFNQLSAEEQMRIMKPKLSKSIYHSRHLHVNQGDMYHEN